MILTKFGLCDRVGASFLGILIPAVFILAMGISGSYQTTNRLNTTSYKDNCNCTNQQFTLLKTRYDSLLLSLSNNSDSSCRLYGYFCWSLTTSFGFALVSNRSGEQLYAIKYNMHPINNESYLPCLIKLSNKKLSKIMNTQISMFSNPVHDDSAQYRMSHNFPIDFTLIENNKVYENCFWMTDLSKDRNQTFDKINRELLNFAFNKYMKLW